MNETIRQARLSHWAQIIAQCNRESVEQHISKKDWMKTHGINSKSFYRKQKEIRELLINTASSGSELPPALQPSPSFVEIPLVGPGRTVPQPIMDSPGRTDPVSETSADLTVRYRGITMEISNTVSGPLLAFVKEVLRNA